MFRYTLPSGVQVEIDVPQDLIRLDRAIQKLKQKEIEQARKQENYRLGHIKARKTRDRNRRLLFQQMSHT